MDLTAFQQSRLALALKLNAPVSIALLFILLPSLGTELQTLQVYTVELGPSGVGLIPLMHSCKHNEHSPTSEHTKNTETIKRNTIMSATLMDSISRCAITDYTSMVTILCTYKQCSPACA